MGRNAGTGLIQGQSGLASIERTSHEVLPGVRPPARDRFIPVPIESLPECAEEFFRTFGPTSNARAVVQILSVGLSLCRVNVSTYPLAFMARPRSRSAALRTARAPGSKISVQERFGRDKRAFVIGYTGAPPARAWRLFARTRGDPSIRLQARALGRNINNPWGDLFDRGLTGMPVDRFEHRPQFNVVRRDAARIRQQVPDTL